MKKVTFNGDFRVFGEIKVPENLIEAEDIIEYICKNVDIKDLKIFDVEFDDVANVYDENENLIYRRD